MCRVCHEPCAAEFCNEVCYQEYEEGMKAFMEWMAEEMRKEQQAQSRP